MALSVKRFTHSNDCPEPSEQINVMYHPTDPQVLCDGGGTLTALFGEVGNLFELSMGSDDGFAGQGDVCAEGMDVVFVVDYTGSMSGAISGVKTGIANLVNTIDTESNSNYRLGLVLFDGGACRYNTSNFYTSLPANQKINDGCFKIITCVEKMSTVGNSTSFTNGLNSIDTPDMPMGASTEWGMTAISEVVNNGFAGSFRSGVQKLIILITDDDPQQDAAYATTLKSQLDAEGFQVMYNTSVVSGDSRYNTLLETQPAGDGHYNLDYNSTWTEGLEVSIASLCATTFIYTCDPPAIGYYMEPGTDQSWYWNGTSWNGPLNCTYTVRVNMHTALGATTYDVHDIPSTHANYVDSNTFEFSGLAGTSYDIGNTWWLDPINDWSIDEISGVSVQTVSGSLGDFTIYTNPAVTGSTLDPTITPNTGKYFEFGGTITGNAEYNIYIDAKTSQDVHGFSITVVSSAPDGTNADGEAQEPDGTVQLDPQTPATSWLNVLSSYPSSTQATKYTFFSHTGVSHTFDVDFDQNPSDYDFTLNSITPQYSHPGAQTAVDSNYTANVNGITGSFNMPQNGGSAVFTLSADVNQPEYLFTLQLSENIAGAGIVGGNFSQSSYYGYTGDTIPWISNLFKVGNYDSFTITSGNMSNGVSLTTGSGSGIGEVITTNTNIGGNITMPAGGGSGSGVFSGVSVESEYDFSFSIADDFTNGDYGADFTVTGTVGETINTTKTLQGTNAEITYAISRITNSHSAVTVTNVGTTLTIKVVMPSGGGSDSISVEGTESTNTYSYTVTFNATDGVNGSLYGWEGTSSRTRQKTVSGAAGTVFTIKPDADLVTIQDYYSQNSGKTSPRVFSMASELSNPSYTVLTETSGTNSITEGIAPEVILTMPSGGGAGTVTTLLVPAAMTYQFNVGFATDSSNSGVVAHTCSADASGISRTAISGGAQTVTFTGSASQTWTNVQVPVRANNTADYDNEIDSISHAMGSLSGVSATEGSNYCGADVEFAAFNFKMPSLDPRFGINYNSRSVTINDTVTAISRRFVLTSVHNISNASVVYSDLTQTFDGAVGSQHNYTSNYTANSGYENLTITGVSDNSSSVTSSILSNTSVGGVITMPSGGGTATVTASGYTSQIQYTQSVTITESIANASLVNGNSSGQRVLSITGAPGTTQTFSEALSLNSGYHYTSGPAIAHSGDGITSSINNKTGVITISLTVGYGNRSGTASVTGSTTQTVRSLSINYLESITGAFMSSGGGTGYHYPYTAETVYGVPGTTGTLTRYLMPNTGYVSAQATSVTDNSGSTSPSIGSQSSGNGTGIIVSYTIPNSNGTSTITINGTAVQATAATSATTQATAATTQATPATAATTKATAATIATTQATEATAATTRRTLATIATTKATAATTKYYYYTVQDCNGEPWIARSTYSTPRFTYHNEGLTTPYVGPGPMQVTSGDLGIQDWDITLFSPTQETCEGGGDPVVGGPKGGGGGGGGDREPNELEEAP
ncbi:VWA domain-containing protein [bacterium]|nr:VWA domain-containing protein [bacterium]